MTNKNPRRDGITAGAAGKLDATEFTSPLLPDQADADDLRVEHIAAQLEEAEQQRLTDDWIDWIKEQQHPDADAGHSPPSLVSFKDGRSRKITSSRSTNTSPEKSPLRGESGAASEASIQRRRRGRPRKYSAHETLT